MTKKTLFGASFAIAFSFQCAAAQEAYPVLLQPAPREAIASQTLKETGTWGINATIQGLNPLKSDLWQGAHGPSLGILFDKIGNEQKFLPINQMVRRVLFSGGIAPDASAEVANKRFRAAARLGPAEGAISLLTALPTLNEDADMAALAAQTYLAAGKNDEGCAIVNDTQTTVPHRLILELQAVCYGLNNEAAAAQLSLDLASTISNTPNNAPNNDNWLGHAIAMIGQPSNMAKTIPLRADNGHYFALSNHLGLEANNATLANASTQTLAKMAQLQNPFPNSLQEQFIKNAIKSGVLPIEAYRDWRNDIMSAPTPEPAVEASITSPSISEMKPAISPPSIIYEGENFGRELAAARDFGDWWVITRRIGDKLGQIKNPNPIDVESFIDAALANQDMVTARLFMSKSSQTRPYRQVILASLDDTIAQTIIRDALSTNSSTNYPKSKIIADLQILWAQRSNDYGQEALLNTAAAGGTALNSNIIAAFNNAVARGSKAEVILGAALALQSIDPSRVDLSQIAILIKGFRSVGLNSEARELATFALLARRMEFAPIPSQTSARPNAAPTPASTVARPRINAPPAKPAAAPPPTTSPQTVPTWTGARRGAN